MPSLKDLRNRISSVKATQKITKAMQMVAAAKLRKAQERAESGRPYAEKMADVISNLSLRFEEREDAPKIIKGNGKSNIHLLVVLTSERGLCGGFNANIVKLAKLEINKLVSDGKEIKLLTVGKKAYELLKREYGKYIIEDINFAGVSEVGYDEANYVGSKIIELFQYDEIDICKIYYGKFQSVMTQKPTEHQLIPISHKDLTSKDETSKADTTDSLVAYEFEPDAKEILNDLLNKNISIQIFKALMENAASEQGARMTAMDNATRNAGDMIDGLTLKYNRARQAMITNELIEIISGAEAL